MISNKEIKIIMRKVISDNIDSGQHDKDIMLDEVESLINDDDYSKRFARLALKQMIDSIVRDFEKTDVNSSQVELDLDVPGTQKIYTFTRNGKSVIMPKGLMTITELQDKSAQHRKSATGDNAHADSLDYYIKLRMESDFGEVG